MSILDGNIKVMSEFVEQILIIDSAGWIMTDKDDYNELKAHFRRLKSILGDPIGPKERVQTFKYAYVAITKSDMGAIGLVLQSARIPEQRGGHRSGRQLKSINLTTYNKMYRLRPDSFCSEPVIKNDSEMSPFYNIYKIPDEDFHIIFNILWQRRQR